jgi:DnaK suppressor protein
MRAGRLRHAHERAIRRVAELTEVFEAIVESSRSANLDDEHDPEGATVGFERAQVLALLERAHGQLAEIDLAADRLRHGTYGACEQCGQPIAEERLAAQVATRTCIACAGP